MTDATRSPRRTPPIGLLCRPVDLHGLPADLRDAVGPPMADDTILPCGFCGTQVWAAPKKRLLYALRGLPLMCLGCGMVQLSVGTKVRGATGKPPPELVAYDLSPYREEHPRIGPAT